VKRESGILTRSETDDRSSDDDEKKFTSSQHTFPFKSVKGMQDETPPE
jgi:hypothetical protein